MGDQIYSLEALRKRAVELLRKHGGHQTTWQIASGLNVHFSAVDRVLEAAYLAKEVTFEEGVGWAANACVQQKDPGL